MTDLPKHTAAYTSAEDQDEATIDLKEVWRAFVKNIWIILLLTVVGGAAVGLGAKLFITPTYESSATIFLTPKVDEDVVDYNSINTNQKLTNNVMNLVTQDNIMSVVAAQVGFPTTDDVRDKITVSNITNTELITISVITDDAKLSKDIAETTVNTFINTMSSNLNVKNIEVVDPAKLDYEPVGPNIRKYTIAGALIGFLISMAVIVIRVMNDKRLKTRDAAESYLGIPVYAELPDLE